MPKVGLSEGTRLSNETKQNVRILLKRPRKHAGERGILVELALGREAEVQEEGARATPATFVSFSYRPSG